MLTGPLLRRLALGGRVNLRDATYSAQFLTAQVENLESTIWLQGFWIFAAALPEPASREILSLKVNHKADILPVTL